MVPNLRDAMNRFLIPTVAAVFLSLLWGFGGIHTAPRMWEDPIPPWLWWAFALLLAILIRSIESRLCHTSIVAQCLSNILAAVGIGIAVLLGLSWFWGALALGYVVILGVPLAPRSMSSANPPCSTGLLQQTYVVSICVLAIGGPETPFGIRTVLCSLLARESIRHITLAARSCEAV